MDFFNSQIENWELARKNFKALAGIKRKPFKVNDIEGYVMFNPGRIRSVNANVDTAHINARKCFLCKENRPPEQDSLELISDWELLVNPFPVFPLHFTITFKSHIPQTYVPSNIFEMNKILRGFTIFFNGAKCGASAPDHAHLQAVLKSEIPLINIIDNSGIDLKEGFHISSEIGLDFPFLFFLGIFEEGNISVIENLKEFAKKTNFNNLIDFSMMNTFSWISQDSKFKFLAIPRMKHRPECFFKEVPERIMISPASVEMGGVIICSLEEDFERIDEQLITNIYKEVGINK